MPWIRPQAGVLFKSTIRWRRCTGQSGTRLRWPTRSVFLLSGQNVSNLRLPTSRTELLNTGPSVAFIIFQVKTLFREEQKGGGGWEQRWTLKRREMETMDLRVQSVGSGRLFVWAAFFSPRARQESSSLPWVSFRRTPAQPWCWRRDAGRLYAEATKASHRVRWCCTASNTAVWFTPFPWRRTKELDSHALHITSRGRDWARETLLEPEGAGPSKAESCWKSHLWRRETSPTSDTRCRGSLHGIVTVCRQPEKPLQSGGNLTL